LEDAESYGRPFNGFLTGCGPMTLQITDCACDLLPYGKASGIVFS